MIDLTWREIRQVFVEEDTLYSALLYVYRTYIGDENDSIDEIIEGIQDNIENYKEEFLSILDAEIDTGGEISNDNITELLDNEEFMKEFRQYLCD